MTVVDLVKARAYAAATEANEIGDHIAADWINELADEVESQERTIRELRALVADVEADAAKLLAERDAVLATLQELFGSVSKLLSEMSRLS